MSLRSGTEQLLSRPHCAASGRPCHSLLGRALYCSHLDCSVNASWQVVLDGISENAYVFPFSSTGQRWTGGWVTLYIEQQAPPTALTAAATPFIVAARRSGDTMPLTSLLARQAVPAAAVRPFLPGALWFGMTGKATTVFPAVANAAAYRTPSNVTGAALFRSFSVGMTPPSAMPKDIYGQPDVCVAAGLAVPAAVTVTVAASDAPTAVIEGLSSNFPYTVTVRALGANGSISPPSPPIPGLYFYARAMPPRQQALRLWIDAYWQPSGAVTSAPDASGAGHGLINAAVYTTQRPSAQRIGGTFGFAQSGYMRFTRASVRYSSDDSCSSASLLPAASKTASMFSQLAAVPPSMGDSVLHASGPLRLHSAPLRLNLYFLFCPTCSLPLQATFLSGDADAYHLSPAGPLTVYIMSRNRLTSTQILIGRGPLASRLGTIDAGWALAVSSTSVDTSTGFLSFRVGAHPTVQQLAATSVASSVNVAAAQARSAVTCASCVQRSYVFSGAVSAVPSLAANASTTLSLTDARSVAALLPADYNTTRYPLVSSAQRFKRAQKQAALVCRQRASLHCLFGTTQPTPSLCTASFRHHNAAAWRVGTASRVCLRTCRALQLHRVDALLRREEPSLPERLRCVPVRALQVVLLLHEMSTPCRLIGLLKAVECWHAARLAIPLPLRFAQARSPTPLIVFALLSTAPLACRCS